MAEGGGEGQATGARTGTPDVFISYASPDSAVAEAVCDALEHAGIRCWVAPRNVMPGDFYGDAIVHAIDSAKAIVLILSQHSAGSPHVLREVERASSKRHPVVSLRIDHAPLPAGLEYFLNTSQWLDASGGEIRGALPKLAAAAQRLVTPSSLGNAGHAGEAVRPEATLPLSPPVGKVAHQSRRWVVLALTTLIAVTLAYFLADKFWISKRVSTAQPVDAVGRPPPSTTPAANAVSEKSIAVLPFADLSEKHDQEYFADGLAEEVLSLLATLPDLKVISRTSSFQFKGKDTDLRTVGTQLGVAYVVEGSVRRYGNRVRVTAQLIDTRDGVHRWSESYDREIGDILRMQQDIAIALGRALQIEVGSSSLQAPMALRSEESYTEYLRGMHALDRYTKTGFEEAVSHFEHALALDSGLVRAREALALTHFLQYAFGFVSPIVGAEAARRDVDRVLRDNPRSVMGHSLRARLLTTYDWDWAAAQREADVALSLDRNSGLALYAAADLAAALGRWDEAEKLFQNALSIDPLDADTRSELGYTLYRAGRFAEAEAECRRVLEIRPSYVDAHFSLALVLLARGQTQAALHEMQQEALEGGQLSGLAIVYYALGRKADSDSALSRAERDVATQGPFNIASIHAIRGEANAAFHWLERAYAEKDYSLQYIKGEWRFSSLQKDARYKALLQKMNLPPE